MSDKSLTITEFCAGEQICRGTFYNLQAKGLAPATIKIGGIIRITQSSRDEWRRKMQELSQPQAA